MSEHVEHRSILSYEHIVPMTGLRRRFRRAPGRYRSDHGVAYIDLGRWNTVVALVIAVTKMLLVVLFFMHVKYNTGLTRIAIVGAFFWLGIMISFSLPTN